MSKISVFKGEYAWLSNFATCIIRMDNMIYGSVEHAYMSFKCADNNWWKTCSIEGGYSCSEIKKLGAAVELVQNWDKVKIGRMGQCLQSKFNQAPYKELLLSTGNALIQEGNWWNDTFWGVDINTGKGENHLGRLIMLIRGDLQKNSQLTYNEKVRDEKDGY